MKLSTRLVSLSLLAVCLGLTACAAKPRKAEIPEPADSCPPPSAVDPQVLRRVVKRFTPDKGNIEVGGWLGATSVEDFSTNSSYGLAVGLYRSEDFFLRADVGKTTLSNNHYAQVAAYGFVPLTGSDARVLHFDSLSLGYNFLPGEVFFGRNVALNSDFYLIAGVGSVKFLGETHLAENFGAGFKVFPTDHLNVNFEVNDRMFSSTALGFSKNTNNIELRIGVNFIF
jgi:outer membrane beta-barrel protein